MNKFIIFGSYRCGTTTLCQIFDANNAPVLQEPFGKNVINKSRIEKLCKYSVDEILKEIFQKYDAIKHQHDQLKIDANLSILKKYPIIYIYRKNFFESAISFNLFLKTRIWASYQVGFKESYCKPIYLNSQDVYESAKQYEKYTFYYLNYLKESNANFFPISYEELYSGKGFEKIKEIFDFLKRPIINEKKIHELLSPKYKLNKKPWSETIKNYSNIQKHFIKLI